MTSAGPRACFGGEGALEAFEEPVADAVEGFVEGVDVAVGFGGDFLAVLFLVVGVLAGGAGGGGEFFDAGGEGFGAGIKFFVMGFVIGGESAEGGIGEEMLGGVLAFAEVENGEEDEFGGPGEEGAGGVELVEVLPGGHGGFLEDFADVFGVAEEGIGVGEEVFLGGHEEAHEFLGGGSGGGGVGVGRQIHGIALDVGRRMQGRELLLLYLVVLMDDLVLENMRFFKLSICRCLQRIQGRWPGYGRASSSAWMGFVAGSPGWVSRMWR